VIEFNLEGEPSEEEPLFVTYGGQKVQRLQINNHKMNEISFKDSKITLNSKFLRIGMNYVRIRFNTLNVDGITKPEELKTMETKDLNAS
jgi:hypothetical protein